MVMGPRGRFHGFPGIGWPRRRMSSGSVQLKKIKVRGNMWFAGKWFGIQFDWTSIKE